MLDSAGAGHATAREDKASARFNAVSILLSLYPFPLRSGRTCGKSVWSLFLGKTAHKLRTFESAFRCPNRKRLGLFGRSIFNSLPLKPYSSRLTIEGY
jgi:hypothetical protein